MSKYIYNGWEFEQLPNQDTHPYWASYIYKTIYLDQAGDYRATLSDSPHRVTELYVANGVYLDPMLSTPGNGVELRLNANGDWVVSREFSPENYTPYGDPHHILVIDGEVVIWSNYAIYFDDGRLYQMAGATPYPVGGTPVDPDEPDIPDVPVEPEEPPVEEKKDFCLRSWLTGFCLGMAGKPLPLSKEPVAYLYNGVQLPPLPDWDKEKYPCAIIVSGKNLNFKTFYSLYITNKPIYDAAGCLCETEVLYTLYRCMESDIESGVWTLMKEDVTGDFNLFNGPANTTKVWANYDILSAEGELVFAASAPVPVYG